MQSSRLIVLGGAAGILGVVVVILALQSLSPSIDRVIITNPPGAAGNQSISFVPENVVIIIGVNSSVTWINNDNAPHTSHSNVPEFDSGIYGAGDSFDHVFSRPGTFPYHCDLHPWMTGIITVLES